MSQLSGPNVVDPPREGAEPERDRRNSRGERVAVNFWEEIFLGGSMADEPPNILFELRVAGELDEETLREAIVGAMAIHPMARARLASPRFVLRPPEWRIVEAGEIDAAGLLEVVACDEDPGMNAIRGAFCSRTINLFEAPGFRTLLVRRPGGDSFLISVHHAIADGIGALRLVNSIARAYAGQADPVPEVDPLSTREVRDFVARSQPSDDEPTTPEGGPADSVMADGASGGPGYGVVGVVLPSEACARLDPRPYGSDVSLNDLLLAAVHAAVERWNGDRGEPCGRIAVLVPVSPRPAEWSSEIVANIVYSDRNLSTIADRQTPTSLVASVTAQMRRLKLGSGLPRLFRRPRWAYWLITRVVGPLFVYRILPSPKVASLQYSLVLSNLGRIERKLSGFGPGPGAITEFWSTPPATMPMGLAMSTVILKGRLHVTLRYRLAKFGESAARAFLESYIGELKSLGGLGS